MDDLFANIPEPQVSLPDATLIATVAVEQAIDRELDYIVPEVLKREIEVGQRVKVPLGRGNRATFGYVVELKGHSDFARSKLKEIKGIDDARALIRPALLQLARWMGRYYITPLGTVLESLIPSAVKKRAGLARVTQVSAALTAEEMRQRMAASKRGKSSAVLSIMLKLDEGERIEIGKLAQAAKTTPATVRKMAAAGLLRFERETDFGLPVLGERGQFVAESPLKLNPHQQLAFDSLLPAITDGRFCVGLLHGITGSGKTEVYLHCIDRIVAAGKQAIVLVPEIALTPQTVRRFTRRFEHVAVLHSGLGASERHTHWRTIAAGRAQVVVGARSAIFAPVPNLGLIVIDEEHESSYKQETAPRYHARDVAIMRAQMQDVPVILGSATPSLEMYHRVRAGEKRVEPGKPPAYLYLHLPARATAQQNLPKVELVDMKLANMGRQGIHLLSPRMEDEMSRALAAGRQAILLLNRRGYASYIWCPSCGRELKCRYCDVGMVYHRNAGHGPGSARAELAAHSGQLHCHYCLAINPLPTACPDCGKKLSLFGLGTQRVEEELQRKFPGISLARMDSDTMRSSRDYERVLGDFGSGKIQLLMGTQMIAKGLDFPNVTVVGVVSGDTALMLPDFRSAERTFQLITQVAGRAGRGEHPGRVILQTYMPDDLTIQAAIKHDYQSFATRELELRRQASLPPFARMARIVLRDMDEQKLQALADQIGDRLKSAAAGVKQVHVQGPMPCAIERIAGYFRQQLVLSSPLAGPLQQVLGALRKEGSLMQAQRIAIDVDPTSLL